MLKKLTAEQVAKNTREQNAGFNYKRARVALNMANSYKEFHGEEFEKWSSGLGIQECGMDEFGMPDYAVIVYYKNTPPKDFPTEIEGVKVRLQYMGEIRLE